jgi:Transglutaminase-like superfamily
VGAREEILVFYRMPAKMTSAGACAPALAALPRDIPSLVRIVQGLLLHEHIAPAYGVELSDARRGETHTRTAERILELVRHHDAGPLTRARALENRVVGTCRNFTVLLVTLLRAQGTPARARCGFAAYFEPGKFIDHWVAECWDAAASRWVRVDAQIDELQRSLFHVDFGVLDVPHDRFLIAGDAWAKCRSRAADPSAFGILDLHGLWFIAGNVVRDAAALNNMEMLPWDCWGPMPQPGQTVSEAQLAFFDRLASRTRDPDGSFDELRTAYQTGEGIRVPGTVFNAVLNRPDVV